MEILAADIICIKVGLLILFFIPDLNISQTHDGGRINDRHRIASDELVSSVMVLLAPRDIAWFVKPKDAQINLGWVNGSDLTDVSSPCFGFDVGRRSR